MAVNAGTAGFVLLAFQLTGIYVHRGQGLFLSLQAVIFIFLKTDQGGLAQGSKEGGPESSDNRSVGGNYLIKEIRCCSQPIVSRLSISERINSVCCCCIQGKPILLLSPSLCEYVKCLWRDFKGTGDSSCLWGTQVGGRFLFHGIPICTLFELFTVYVLLFQNVFKLVIFFLKPCLLVVM